MSMIDKVKRVKKKIQKARKIHKAPAPNPPQREKTPCELGKHDWEIVSDAGDKRLYLTWSSARPEDATLFEDGAGTMETGLRVISRYSIEQRLFNKVCLVCGECRLDYDEGLRMKHEEAVERHEKDVKAANRAELAKILIDKCRCQNDNG